MSFMMMARAMEVKVGSSARKLVLLKLADNANDNGECHPSYQHIADQCEMSRRSVITHIAALIEQGLLVKIERLGGEKRNRSNKYILNFSGEKFSLGGENSAPLNGENPALGGENISPLTSENSAPRSYHSFDPIKEPIVCNTSHTVCNQSHTSNSTEQAFEIFWEAGMRKVNKKRALSLFAGLCKREKLDPVQFAEQLANDVRRRVSAQQMGFDRLHPTTYLSNERWGDEVVSGSSPDARSSYNCDKCGSRMDDCGCWAEDINEGVF